MLNMQTLMKQAQAMQKKMEDAQSKMAVEEVEGTSGGGMINVIMNGKFEMKKINIDKSLLDENEVEFLEDLIIAACNDARNKADAKMQSSVSDVTGGMNLGGLKLPF